MPRHHARSEKGTSADGMEHSQRSSAKLSSSMASGAQPHLLQPEGGGSAHDLTESDLLRCVEPVDKHERGIARISVHITLQSDFPQRERMRESRLGLQALTP